MTQLADTTPPPPPSRTAWGPRRFDILRPVAPPASRLPAPRFSVLQGVGPEANYLRLISLAAAPEETPAQLGWQVPYAAQIPVKMAGARDADWSLEPDEMAY